MENKIKGKQHYRKVFAVVGIFILLASLFVGAIQTAIKAAEVPEKVNIVVTKYGYENMPGANALIDNGGLPYSALSGEKSKPDNATAIPGARFRLYRFNNKTTAAEQSNDKQYEFSAEMYNSLVTLIDNYKFNAPDMSKNGAYTIEASKYTAIQGFMNTAAGFIDGEATITNAGSEEATKEFNALIQKIISQMMPNEGRRYATTRAIDGGAGTGGSVQTDSAGQIKYMNIDNSYRYLLVELPSDSNDGDAYKKYETSRQVATPMLIDLPIIKEDGQKLNNENNPNVYIYPKNEYPVGGTEFYKIDGGESTVTPLKGAKFNLYKITDEETWESLKTKQLDVTANGKIADNETNSDIVQIVNASTLGAESDGITFESDNKGIVKVTGLTKGNYFFVEKETPAVTDGDDEYSLNRYPIYFTIDNDNANGGTTTNAVPNNSTFIKPSVTIPENSGWKVTTGVENATKYAFPNYSKPTIEKTVNLLKSDGTLLKSNVNGGLDNTGIGFIEYELQANLANPSIALADATSYMAFYDIFTTKNINTWDYYTSGEDGNGNQPSLLDIRNVFEDVGSDNDGVGNHLTGFYYGRLSAPMQVTRIIGNDLNAELLIKNKAGHILAYYGASNANVEKYSGNGITVEYLGKYLDDYKIIGGNPNTGDDVSTVINGPNDPENTLGNFMYDSDTLTLRSGVGHIGWFDPNEVEASMGSFEPGTATGTQLAFAVNVKKIVKDLKNSDIDQSSVGKFEMKFRLKPKNETMLKGIEINNIGQFEWSGGLSEETIIEDYGNIKVGGANFLKTDDLAAPLPGAQFQIYRKIWDTTLNSNTGGWKTQYLQGSNTIGSGITTGEINGTNFVNKWVDEASLATSPTLDSYFNNKKVGTAPENNPTVYAASSGAGNGKALFTVRGLAPSLFNNTAVDGYDNSKTGSIQYYLHEIATPNAELLAHWDDAEWPVNLGTKPENKPTQYRELKNDIPFQVFAQDFYKDITTTGSSDIEKENLQTSIKIKTPTTVVNNLDTNANKLKKIMNTKATPFPITGGIGSLFLILLGLLGVAYWYMRKRRMALAEQEAE